tara:strand:- start:576 stop:758 length:183 start_codon:yes stop_codon:yes gene_type:complete
MKTVAVYNIKGKEVEVVECGSEPDLYYDVYVDGLHLNAGEPWHENGEGVPSSNEIEGVLE